MPRVQLRRRQGRRRIACVLLDLTPAVTSYAEGQYAEGLHGHRHRAYMPTVASTPRVDVPPPREVYAEEVRRRLPSAYDTPTALG
jgi:hypothetical protein